MSNRKQHNHAPSFPMNFRRVRQTPAIRRLMSEVTLHKKNLIQPYFLQEGIKTARELPALFGQQQHTLSSLKRELEKMLEAGINSTLLFIVPDEKKKREKSFNFSFDLKAISEIKKSFGDDLVLWTDLCLCSNTSSGHCGALRLKANLLNKNPKQTELFEVDNDLTVRELQAKSLAYAEAGADGIAPSDMMDDRVFAIREILDHHGYHNKLIMSYSSKFSSNLYGPFRKAANSAPSHGDRKSYQLAQDQTFDAIRCAIRDVAQGADIIMVKPAGWYLDIIYRLKHEALLAAPVPFPVPVAAYQVSGEYQAIALLAREGCCNFESAYLESLIALKRAGSDIIITYGATSLSLE
ncbi:MAG: porphobilinogen synthase [Oligoflexia bacterium]|nr:porphobilinogen synthase [Oligoflexia bacterium]MBF0366752.1 porphobilinogen synthase [Oligoflexia bacterium]